MKTIKINKTEEGTIYVINNGLEDKHLRVVQVSDSKYVIETKVTRMMKLVERWSFFKRSKPVDVWRKHILLSCDSMNEEHIIKTSDIAIKRIADSAKYPIIH